MTTYLHDVAISAVAYDRVLVAELTGRLIPHLRVRPWWDDGHAERDALVSPLAETSSRVALVLHQRLWGHDDVTRGHSPILQARVRCRPGSLVVAALDESPLPDWAAGVRAYTLSDLGVAGVADAVLDAMAGAGGVVLAPRPRTTVDEVPAPPWDAPREFLNQARAHSALQRELDALSAELRPRLQVEEGDGSAHVVEFPARPNRRIARFDDVGVSFSWVPGAGGAVADGRLLVIEWGGLHRAKQGALAFIGATATRERVYRPEAHDPEAWRWRADEPNGRASATADLVGEWLSGALMARHGFETT